MTEAPAKENPAGAGLTKETAALILAQDEDITKTGATWIAKFALAGHSVHELAGGGFLVVHPGWGMARECPNLSALIAFARQIGVRE